MATESRTTSTAPRPDGPERRAFVSESLRVEWRAEGETPRSRIVGHAVVFNRWTTLYEGQYFVWREIVRPGATRNAIAERQDVRSLFNHDPNYVLGRTSAGTLILAEDSTGLLTDTDAPQTQTIRDLVLAPIERRDISEMSFAFLPRNNPEAEWTVKQDGKTTVIDRGGERITIYEEKGREIEERELLTVNLYDVSPVTFAAYKQTDVALRSLAERREHLIQGRANRRPHLRRAEMRLRMHDAAALSTR